MQEIIVYITKKITKAKEYYEEVKEYISENIDEIMLFFSKHTLVSTGFISVLEFLGVYNWLFTCSFVGFIIIMILDFLSKQHQYIRHFGSMNNAIKARAWETHIRRTQTKDKIKEYGFMLTASIITVSSLNAFEPINLDIGGFLLTQEKIVLLVLFFMASIEFESIYVNLTTDISEEEKKKWGNPPDAGRYVEMSESERMKWKGISTIVHLGFDRIISLLKLFEKKGGDKDGK
ncbi:hypothetical protein QYF48_16135 [Brevibacillus agri]|uniref:hypothetical protein n=1 Tax=Brevibacillus agri TaxID=51101 RepID=UPI0025B64997|nr:hypothetical protein [Brevibacillus agri]MDN4094338.1 hypothetical protein [Brevibacillus agri]